MIDYINREALRKKMVAYRFSLRSLSAIIGCTYGALSFKLNGKNQFKESEIAILYKMFGKDILIRREDIKL